MRATLAMFAAGLATFMTLYCVQALLPAIADRFGLTPATASLTVSTATATMALAVIPLTALSDLRGRTPVMIASLVAAGICGVAASFAPDFGVLLVIRLAQGVALAGVQATALSYLHEEVDRGSVGAAVGLYVAGNGIGGMGGRLLASGVLAASGSWRWAIGAVGLASLLCAVVFVLLVPRSVRFRPVPGGLRAPLAGIGRSFADSGMLRLYLLGFLTMSGMVTVYNYLGFRLKAAPFHLSQNAVGFIFVVFLAGSVSATVAGRLVDRFGRPRVLTPAGLSALAGLLVMLTGTVPLIIVGLAVFTSGIFSCHAVCSGWAGHRSRALGAQGSAAYMSCTYFGSALISWLGGYAYDGQGWIGTTVYTGALQLIALATGLTLWRLRAATRTNQSPEVQAPQR